MRRYNIRLALAQLPDGSREAVEYHHLQGMSLEQTARRLDRTTTAVVGLLRRGIDRLHEILQGPDSRNS